MQKLLALVAGAAAIVAVNTADVPKAQAGCVVGVANWDVLNIRFGPGTRFSIKAAIPPHACGVRFIGPCRRAWCRIGYGPHVGWVHTRYIRW